MATLPTLCTCITGETRISATFFSDPELKLRDGYIARNVPNWKE